MVMMLSVALMGRAQQWVDVTEDYVTNPGFDGNSSKGWTWSSNAQSQTVRVECMEFWNGMFDIWQVLSGLNKGHYRLSVQAYYRTGDFSEAAWRAYQEGTEEITAVFYAGVHETPVASVYSYELPYYLSGCWTYSTGNWWEGGEEHYYANSMENGREAFDNGAYWNTLTFEAEGDVTIGLRTDSYNRSNWCLFDNFKLEISSDDIVKVEKVSLSLPMTELVVGQTVQAVATVSPENATKKQLTWRSTNTNVATVDANGLVKAVGAGRATIRATSADGTNKSAAVAVTVVNNMADASSLVINEIMPANVDEYLSPAFNFDGWIEFYNPTDVAATIGGLYLSDDAANPLKWRMPDALGTIPAKGFKMVWTDSNELAPQNAPFKLDEDGGTIIVSDARGNTIASQSYPSAIRRTSYARTTDGGDTWGRSATPTPEASNNGAVFAASQLAAPEVDQPSQLFVGSLSVNVTIPAGCTLRYTDDGRLPTETVGAVSQTGQFRISSTATLRFRLFKDGMLPSDVTSRSYIESTQDYTLPVVAVVTDPDFIWSTEIGVFEKGPNGRPGNGQSVNCNWNMDWERPVSFSYLTADGEMVLNQEVNLEMCGGWSRAFTPHSFKLKGNKELSGNKHLDYPFFAEKPYLRNRTLQIRNGGNDTGCRIKDPALQYIVQTSGLDMDVQSYQPVHEFINGEYMGVLNVREPNNKHFVYSNYGWDDDEIDQFEMSPDSGYVQKCGTAEMFDYLVSLSQDAANSDTYAEICQLLDIDEYTNYMALELYLGSDDWPKNNIKGFRHRDGGKFRFVLFDLDHAFNSDSPISMFMNREYWTFDQLYPTSLGRIYAQIKFVTLFKNLLQNASFRRRFIAAYSIMGGSVYEATRSAQIIEELAARVNPAMQLEGRSANSTANTLKSQLSRRLSVATSALKGYSTFGLERVTTQRVKLESNAPGARLTVNGQVVPTGRFDGNLFAPVTLKAEALAGYAFEGWSSQGTTTGSTLMAKGSEWHYYDQGSLDGQNWTSPTYAENGWAKGRAPLGYGNPNITATTTLDYGSNANNKRPTYYFRTQVSLDQAPAADDVFSMEYVVDDGIIVYVNGSEAARFNMPSGSVGYNTYASTYAYDNPEQGTLTLPASLFHKGTNTIAVELHNNSGNSTDILWDASLTAQLANMPTELFATEPEIQLPSGSSLQFTACYRKLSDAERSAQGVTPVRINEVSGSNNIFVNDYFKKNDWVELYNTTDEEIDVEGMYLTDDKNKPTKYQISKASDSSLFTLHSSLTTVIPAHGHLLVWCDKLQTTAQALHASFKVSGEGGLLMLTAADKSWTDTFYYPAHDGNQTVGRYPDGTADIYLMSQPTIEQPNILTTYAVATDQTELEKQVGVRPPMIAAANGFRVSYGSQQLFVRSDEPGTAAVDIFTTDGRLVERHSLAVAASVARVSVAHLPSGFYVARATSADGVRVACKFMK